MRGGREGGRQGLKQCRCGVTLGKRLIGIKHIKMTAVLRGQGSRERGEGERGKGLARLLLALMTDNVLLSEPVRRLQL